MAKTMKDLLGKDAGKMVTGRGVFSKSGFADLVHSLVNDPSYKVGSVNKDGSKNELSVHDAIVADLKKTLDTAKYPQKAEAGVLDTVEISTKNLAEVIPHIVMEQIKTGKKFDLPVQENVVGGIYLADNPGKVKTGQIRDMKTGQVTGSYEVTYQDSVQIRAKSPVPKSLQKKVKKDLNGNVVK